MLFLNKEKLIEICYMCRIIKKSLLLSICVIMLHASEIFSGNEFGISIVEASIDARSYYRLQTNTSCRLIEQDQNNPSYINVCWMVAPSNQPGFPDRRIRYFFSSNGGSSFDYMGLVTTTRSGFAVMDIFSDGRAIIGCHSMDLTNYPNVHFYYNTAPGAGNYTVITPGGTANTYPIWPQLKVTGSNGFIFAGGGNDIPGIYRNTCVNLLTPGTFSGYSLESDANNINLSVLASNGNKTAIAYISNDESFRRIFIRESSDGGLTFGNSVTVWGLNSDSISALRGIDCSYDENTPNVVFEVNKWNHNQGSWSPGEPSKIYFWSPAINGGSPVLVDSADGITGNSSHIYTSVCRPVIGYSNPDGLTYIAYHKARIDTNEAGENYFDVMIAFSTNSGANWSSPQKVTNQAGYLLDNKYVSISNKNRIIGNTAEVHLLFQQDTIPGLNVPPSNTTMAKMIYAKLTMPLIGIEQLNTGVPEEIILKQNYPNPFNPVTQIEFSVPKTSYVKLKIYNSIGELVTIAAEGSFAPGSYKADFDATNLASGVYYYVMEYFENATGIVGTFSGKMVLMK
jgi:hypothetical protein